MNLNTLNEFRHEVYRCFQRAEDALFNAADALMTETQAQSFPELSLSPYFERQPLDATAPVCQRKRLKDVNHEMR